MIRFEKREYDDVYVYVKIALGAAITSCYGTNLQRDQAKRLIMSINEKYNNKKKTEHRNESLCIYYTHEHSLHKDRREHFSKS